VDTSAQLATHVAHALGCGSVPLLVLRTVSSNAAALEPQTTRAFLQTARSSVREGDRLAHDPGSDWFAIAMLTPSRTGALSLDARAALERIAAAVSLAVGAPMETGWWPIASVCDLHPLEPTVKRALERGARERERFEFLATIGHELRTPLTSIRGYLETVLDDELDASTTRRFLEVARSEALRLGRLVDGILDFSPLDVSSEGAPGATDLSVAIGSAIEALAPIARDAGVRVRARLPASAVARIASDACMHVLLNVVENAIKYGRNGGTVLVRVERQDPFLGVIVDDDGAGIDASDRERIFAHRARGARAEARSGCGLGLSIVRTIVERAGGHVSAAESPLGGARFVIRLPQAWAELPMRLS
jgi:signal transduction histidine kinase